MAVGKESIQRAVKANSVGNTELTKCRQDKNEINKTEVLAASEKDYENVIKNNEFVIIGEELPEYLL